MQKLLSLSLFSSILAKHKNKNKIKKLGFQSPDGSCIIVRLFNTSLFFFLSTFDFPVVAFKL